MKIEIYQDGELLAAVPVPKLNPEFTKEKLAARESLVQLQVMNLKNELKKTKGTTDNIQFILVAQSKMNLPAFSPQ